MSEDRGAAKKRQHRYCRHWDHKWHGVTKKEDGREYCNTCDKPLRWFESGGQEEEKL